MPSERDIERLIRQVTDLVLARLPSSAEAAEGPAGAGRRLELLLPMQTAAIDALIGQLERLGRRGLAVTTRTSARVLAWLERTGRRARLGPRVLALDEACLCESLGDYDPGDVVVLGALGFALAERLARLEDDDAFVRLASQALLGGARVLAVEDDLRPRAPAAPEPVAARAQQALAALGRLGLEPLPAGALAERIERLQAADTTLARSLGGLLGEREVEQLAAAGQRRLVLGPQAIVTPLARSRAGELGLELVEPER